MKQSKNKPERNNPKLPHARPLREGRRIIRKTCHNSEKLAILMAKNILKSARIITKTRHSHPDNMP